MMRRILPVIAAMLLAACQPEAPPPVDTEVAEPVVTLLHNARIHTMDLGSSVIEPGAMAISAVGQIIAIGQQEPMVKAFSASLQVDAGGRVVIPLAEEDGTFTPLEVGQPADFHVLKPGIGVAEPGAVGPESIDQTWRNGRKVYSSE